MTGEINITGCDPGGCDITGRFRVIEAKYCTGHTDLRLERIREGGARMERNCYTCGHLNPVRPSLCPEGCARYSKWVPRRMVNAAPSCPTASAYLRAEYAARRAAAHRPRIYWPLMYGEMDRMTVERRISEVEAWAGEKIMGLHNRICELEQAEAKRESDWADVQRRMKRKGAKR